MKIHATPARSALPRRRGRRRPLSAALAVVGLVVGSFVMGAAPAQAAGTSYDGTDPGATGCTSNAWPIKYFPILTAGGATAGVLEVDYSASCVTNWVRVNNYVAGTDAWKYITREITPSLPSYVYASDVDPGVGWSYTMQLYAPGCIFVEAQIYNGSGYFATSGSQKVC